MWFCSGPSSASISPIIIMFSLVLPFVMCLSALVHGDGAKGHRQWQGLLTGGARLAALAMANLTKATQQGHGPARVKTEPLPSSNPWVRWRTSDITRRRRKTRQGSRAGAGDAAQPHHAARLPAHRQDWAP